MALLSKLMLTDGENQYIRVMVDNFESKMESEVTNCILDFFYNFDAPKRLLTD